MSEYDPDSENEQEPPHGADPESGEVNGLPPLVKMGHPLLARPSREVEPERITTPEFAERLLTLRVAMTAYQGIGIAAPQLGWFERFFLMIADDAGGEEEPGGELHYWINPRIIGESREQCWAWEGCLSVPGLRGWIRRPAGVTVRGLDQHGGPAEREYGGWDARVFQHEYDHLEGMLFPYRAEDPRHLVALDEYERRAEWPVDWPAPGARDAPPAGVVPEP